MRGGYNSQAMNLFKTDSWKVKKEIQIIQSVKGDENNSRKRLEFYL